MFTKHDDDDDDSGITVVMVMVVMNSRNVFFQNAGIRICKTVFKVFYLGKTWSCSLKEEYMSKLTFILQRTICVVAI
jgi:hypothetical protein